MLHISNWLANGSKPLVGHILQINRIIGNHFVKHVIVGKMLQHLHELKDTSQNGLWIQMVGKLATDAALNFWPLHMHTATLSNNLNNQEGLQIVIIH